MMKFIVIVLFSQNLVSQTESSRPSATWTICPFEYHLFQNKCYRYYGTFTEYENAKLACSQGPNGHLMTVDSVEKQHLLETTLLAGRSPKKGAYIGLHTAGTTDFKWYSGSYDSSGYSNWNDSQPSTPAVGMVVYLDTDSLKWIAISDPSNQERQYFCECDTNNRSLGDLFPLCPYGYQYTYNNSCYGYHEDMITWSDAKQKCRCEGGHLVYIGNQEEFDFLSPLVVFRGKKSWIGLSRKSPSSNWTWSDDMSLEYEPGWKEGERSAPAGKDCITMSGYHFGLYQAFDCTVKTYYPICEVQTYQPSKQAVCLEGNTNYTSLFDGDASTCREPPQHGFINLVEVKEECFNNCSSEEVRIVVTLNNADSCSGIPIYYEDVLDCDKPFLMICHLVADHLAAFSQCELLCHCHNSTTQECNLFMKKPANSMPAGYSICEVNLV